MSDSIGARAGPALAAAACLLVVFSDAGGRRQAMAQAPAVRYEEVKDWLRLPAGVQLGEAAGVAVDLNGHVFVFHRPGRGFDTAATTKLTEPAVLEIDAEKGTLIRSWGANMFLVPHGITIDQANNVFLTDVGLQQVFKFTHDGKPLLALGEPRVGAWDAGHFNQPTDIQIRPDGTFYVSDGYVNSRIAIFDRNGRWLQEWGRKGSGPGEFSNPHGIAFVPDSTDVVVADRENSRLQLFDRAGRFKKQWAGIKDAPTTGRVFCVAADRAGNHYVGIRRADYDTEHTGVLKLDRDWNIVAAIGFGQPGGPVFNAVHDIAIGHDGSIYVAETRTKRVAKLRPVATNGATDGGTAAASTGLSFADVTRPRPGEWPTYHGSLSGNRFSTLDQITAATVHSLAPKWMFTIQSAPRPLQMTPVVVDGVMYATSVNEVYALDARTGRAIWHYGRPRTPGLAGDAATGINRGVAVLGDRVFTITDNAHVIALRRDTGQLLWDVEMADPRQNYGATGAPLAVNDLVISGVSGGDEGVRGFLDAYRASTGERVWRFWTVPAPGEPGSETWIGRAIEHGCAATWLTGTYDPESKLLYWPTGNPCPDYNGDERKGDNLYSASVLALDPESGRLRWHYQFTPHDLHDWDANQTPMLLDVAFRGEPRKLLVQGNRNGFFYALDRLTGKVLLAEPFVTNLTWASRIGADGRPLLLPGNEPTRDGQRVCPAVAGATNWPSTAFSPVTGLFYLFAEESCAIYTKNDQWWEAGKSFYGGVTRRADGARVSGKVLKALDIQTGKTAWEVRVGGGILGSGLMATAGGLLFYGGEEGFIAADAASGKQLWQFNTNQNWRAGPMTYALDGDQYIAVAAGSNILAFSLR